MATLHMEVESVRATQSNLMTIHSDLTSQVNTMTNAINGMVGSTWQGNSAVEFQAEYENWRSTMTTLLDQLSTLANRLQTEIAEWEQMAAKLA